MLRTVLVAAFALAVLPAASASAAEKAGKKPAPKKDEPVQLAAAAPLESVNALLQKWRCGALEPAKCPIKTSPSVVLEGFAWGSSKRQVIEQYTRGGGLIDMKFEPQLAKANSSAAMKNIEAGRIMDREAAGQDFVEFDDKRSGLDATFLWKSREYSYANGESVLKMASGFGLGALEARINRYFFFFGGKGDGQRLWKIYEELPLGPSSPFGTDFQDAVTKLSTTLGTVGRMRVAGQAEGVASTQFDWQDDLVHVRLVERPDTPNLAAFVVEERKTYDNLAGLRANKPEDPFALDPSVAGATSGGISDPNAERAGGGATAEDPKGGKKKGGKGR